MGKIDVTPIRNEVWIWYCPEFDPDTNACAVPRTVVTASNGTSQNRYFKRTMVLQEADDSPINTEESAQREEFVGSPTIRVNGRDLQPRVRGRRATHQAKRPGCCQPGPSSTD